MERLSVDVECLNLGDREERYASTDSSIGPRWMIWHRRRDIFCMMTFFGYMNASILRSNLSVAIIAMTSDYPVTLSNGTIIQERDFDWEPVTRGYVLSAFFYGFTLTQVPGGWLAIRFGGHKTYGLGILVTAIFTMLTPSLASVHVYLLIAVRVIVGLSEGLTHTGVEILIGQWIPRPERNFMMGILSTGLPLGNILSMAMSGYVATYLGWRGIFYITGAIGMVWVILWWCLVSDSPQTDTRISPAEQNYIRKYATVVENKTMAMNVPWSQLLTSMPMWSAVLVIFTTSWNFNVLAIQMPAYFKDKLRMDLNKAGLLSSVPYIFAIVTIITSGYLLDLVLAKKWLSTTQLRKLSICTTLVTSAGMLLVLGHVHMTSAYPVVGCITVAMTFDYLSSLSVYYNFLDLAPQYSSVMTGLAHLVSSIGAALTTVTTAHIVTNKSVEEWQTVFSISSGIGVMGAIIYGTFGSGRLQTWAPNYCLQEESPELQNRTNFDCVGLLEKQLQPVPKLIKGK